MYLFSQRREFIDVLGNAQFGFGAIGADLFAAWGNVPSICINEINQR